MRQWLSSWEDAAKHPWRTVLSMFLSGLVAGGLVGYFRFGDSLGYGVALGLGAALILSASAWRTMRDPARVRELTHRRAFSPTALRGAAIRLALPFIALAIAVVAGVAADSSTVFVIAVVVGLATALLLRRFVPR